MAKKDSHCAVTKGEVELAKYEKLDGEWREIGLAAPARRALVDIKLTKLSQLTSRTEKEIKAAHGMGPNAMSVIKREMKKRRLKFKSE